MKYRFLLVLIFFTFSCVQNIDAQNINDQITEINVDDLSDAQIRTYWERAKEEGYTLDELEVLAAGRGMSQVQIAKLRRRIMALPPEDQVARSKTVKSEQPDVQDPVQLFGHTGLKDSISSKKSKIFGFKLIRTWFFRLFYVG